MLNDIKEDAERRMNKSLEALRDELKKIRAGRAHPSLLDQVTVLYYGTETPLQQLATVVSEDARTLSVTPWDKTALQLVEKALRESDLGLNPATSGQNIRVPLPALTEERRLELGKIVRNAGEAARVAIRNIRRDANHTIKELLKEKEISVDEDSRSQSVIQKLTDDHIKEIDQLVSAKERDLLEV